MNCKVIRYIGKENERMLSLFRHKRRKSDEEFDECFRSSYPLLYRHAYFLLHDEEDSRDVVSEVFVNLIEKKKECGNVDIGYLMAMVHNKAIDLLRHRKVEDEARRQMLYDYRTFIASNKDKDMRLKEINQFVESELTPQTQRILRLCYAEKKSYKEVAAELDISIQAVNKHISQALRKLRERFNPQHTL